MQKRIVTTPDIDRLKRLMESASSDAEVATRDALEQELDRANVVGATEVSGQIVTMHSRVRVRDLDRDVEVVCSIVLPGEANADAMRISVLAPLGMALIGNRAGDVVRFVTPGGLRRVRIIAIEYQPEAAARRRVAA